MPTCPAPGVLTRGFRLPAAEAVLYGEEQLFPRPALPRRPRGRRAVDAFVSGLRDLKQGDYVVHDDHGIEYYETPPNRWGISMGGIWIRHNADYPGARRLMDEYQARRARDARALYEDRKSRGEAEGFLEVLRRRPIQVLAYLALAAGVLALFFLPVWLLI